jgi:uncharacterized metal-binding protein YceD (DUF177 family)
LRFSRPESIIDLPPKGKKIHIGPGAEERQAIADFVKIDAVKQLEAHLELMPRKKNVQLKGHVRTKVLHTCVVSLDPFEAQYDFHIQRMLLAKPKQVELDENGEMILDPLASDEDLLDGNSIDLGQVIVEELVLHLDPFPRKPGAVFENKWQEPQSESSADAEPSNSPFAQLATLKQKNDKNNGT